MPEELYIVSRRGPVHQIIVNLIQNAVDVIENQDHQVIDISFNVGVETLSVHVKDNGPGIRPDAIDRIFEPFFTTKPLGQGTGLGLYISYGLAEELGGTITTASSTDGGAEFILSLPLKV
jgi:two-component system sensor histidine kinase HupT/HoxJ